MKIQTSTKSRFFFTFYLCSDFNRPISISFGQLPLHDEKVEVNVPTVTTLQTGSSPTASPTTSTTTTTTTTTTTPTTTQPMLSCQLESVRLAVFFYLLNDNFSFEKITIKKGQLWEILDCNPPENDCIQISLPLTASFSNVPEKVCCSAPQTHIG